MPPATDLFPFRRSLSLAPLVAFWRTQAADPDAPLACQARLLLDRLAEVPALQGLLADASPLEAHRALLHQLMAAVVPPARLDETCVAAYLPFAERSFYATTAFQQLGFEEGGHLLGNLGVSDDAYFTGKAMHAYYEVLRRFYGVEARFDYPIIFTNADAATGLRRHYRIVFDTRFMEVSHEGALPPLDEATLQRLLEHPLSLPLWRALLPPEGFAFSGFVLLSATDATDQEELSALKLELLQRDAMTSPSKIDVLQDRMRTLMRCADLHLGLIGLERRDIESITQARAVGRSLLMVDREVPLCSSKEKSIYARALRGSDPVVVRDLQAVPAPTAFEHRLIGQGLRSFIVAPLFYAERLVGLLELGSPQPGGLDAFKALKLLEVSGLFATALQRSIDEQEDRVQAVIKEKYTAIHPSVEWRFRQAALNYVRRQAVGQKATAEPILFKDVYPFFGLSDIRDSSLHRNEAIRADLVEQLGMGLAVMIEAAIYRPLPILDELGHRISKYAAALEEGLTSGDEVAVLDFIRNDLEPTFDLLDTFGEAVRRRIDAYRGRLDERLGILYERRRDYEESVGLVNDAISLHLEEEEAYAQSMFPHYFEKYKTDGVEYTIYAGASLDEAGRFDPLFLQNLRLWQLMVHCGIHWKVQALQPSLPVPLEVTQLILAHGNPLSIRFRFDEKKFDVDGAYNLRYELIKKRIDKARVRGTGERLTQPGLLAVVYAQAREAQEYRRYLDFLQETGHLHGAVEDVELEDLQGVYGLKALRAPIQQEQPEAEPQASLQALMARSGIRTPAA